PGVERRLAAAGRRRVEGHGAAEAAQQPHGRDPGSGPDLVDEARDEEGDPHGPGSIAPRVLAEPERTGTPGTALAVAGRRGPACNHRSTRASTRRRSR